MSYRFRVDDGKLVLQVLVRAEPSRYDYGWQSDKGTWRDATVEDIPVVDPFARLPSVTYSGEG